MNGKIPPLSKLAASSYAVYYHVTVSTAGKNVLLTDPLAAVCPTAQQKVRMHTRQLMTQTHNTQVPQPQATTNLAIAVTAPPDARPATVFPPDASPTHNPPSLRPAATHPADSCHKRHVTSGGVEGRDDDDGCGSQMGKDWKRVDNLRVSQV
jgi:hypothetical protein